MTKTEIESLLIAANAIRSNCVKRETDNTQVYVMRQQ